MQKQLPFLVALFVSGCAVAQQHPAALLPTKMKGAYSFICKGLSGSAAPIASSGTIEGTLKQEWPDSPDRDVREQFFAFESLAFKTDVGTLDQPSARVPLPAAFGALGPHVGFFGAFSAVNNEGTSSPIGSLSCDGVRWYGSTSSPIVGAVGEGPLSGYIYVQGQLCGIMTGRCTIVLH